MRGWEGLQSPTCGQPHRYAWGHLAELLPAVGSRNGFPGKGFGGDDLHLPPFHLPALGDDDDEDEADFTYTYEEVTDSEYEVE